MRKYFSLFAGLIILTCGCSSSTEIINLDIAKKLVQNYYENGSYDSECRKILNKAKEEIAALTLENSSTVIFDIDDTALSNYEYTKELGFGYNYSTYQQWINDCKFKPIPQVKDFYNWLLSKKTKIVFLTGRYHESLSATRKNLINAGFTSFDTLIVRNVEEKKLPAAEYKAAKREELTNRGYKIIAGIGDQASDFKGNYVGIKIKLPNFLYGIE